MDKLEIDYSLPYEEYLKNFRKIYSKYPQMQPMSKDQYELAQAKAAEEAKKKAAEEAKKKAAEEAGTNGWWEQEGGPAEEIIEKYGNTTSADIAEQSANKQQGIQALGNQGDNINNPNSLDSADIAKLHKQELASAQTPDNMNPATYSISNEDRVQMMKDADISPEKIENEINSTISDSVSAAVTPKEGDTKEVHNAKNKYNKSMMSIWDAYRAGEISKETAGYFTIDAIATLAKNLGRSIGNVGAQFSGGTIDNGHDTSAWEQRKNALLNEEIGKETESIGGAAGRQAESESLDLQAKKIRNNNTPAGSLNNSLISTKRPPAIATIGTKG